MEAEVAEVVFRNPEQQETEKLPYNVRGTLRRPEKGPLRIQNTGTISALLEKKTTKKKTAKKKKRLKKPTEGGEGVDGGRDLFKGSEQNYVIRTPLMPRSFQMLNAEMNLCIIETKSSSQNQMARHPSLAVFVKRSSSSFDESAATQDIVLPRRS